MISLSLHAYLAARIDVIRDDFTRLLRERVPFYQALPERLLAGSADAFLRLFVEGIPAGDATAAATWASDNLRVRAEQGLPFDGALAITTQLRRAVLLSLRSHPDPSVGGVLELVLVIDEMCETLHAVITRFYMEALEHAQLALAESEAQYRQLYTSTPAILHSIDPKGRLVQVSDRWLEVLGYTRQEVLGRRSVEFLSEASRRFAAEVVLPAFFRDGSCKDVHYQLVTKGGEHIDVLMSGVLLRDASGAPLVSLATMVDITEHRRAKEELERSAVREEVLLAQEATLRELLTPLIPVSDGVLVMPLIGAIDRGRADQMQRVLLGGIEAEGATVAILDVTGVPVVDAGVAGALLSAAAAARLLGAEVLFTGIQPGAARAFVEIGVDFRHVVTRATLKDGIGYALARRRRGAVRA
jgi:rsbT co-antagonist protein RsbR